MYKDLLKCAAISLSVLLLQADYAVAKPFRYVGLGAGVNIHGNNDGSDADFHSDDFNAQGTLRVQLPFSENASISGNFFYLNDDPNLLLAVNLHLNRNRSVQPRIGIGTNIVLGNASHNDGGILGHQTSPVLNLGVDAQISQQFVLFGDIYYAVVGNDENDGDSGSLAVVTGVGIQF